MGGGSPEIPQISPDQVLGSVVKYMPQIGRGQWQLAQRFAPRYSRLDTRLLREFAPQIAQIGLDLTQQFAPQVAQTGFDITQQFAPQYAGLGFDISQQYAPQYLGLNLAQQEQAIAGTPILSALNPNVLEDIQNWGTTTPEEAYSLGQQTYGDFAQRGNAISNQAIAADITNRWQFAQAKKMQALQEAAQTQALNLGQLQGLSGVVGMPNLPGYAAPPNLPGYAGMPNFWGQAQAGTGLSPYVTGIGAGSAVSNPLMDILGSIASANQNAAANQAIAGANKGSSTTGSAIGAAGSILGGALMAY